MKKKYHFILIILMVIPVLILSVVSIFDTDKTLSERENRVLSKMPEFDLKNYFSGNFSKEFEEYYSDTFPMRDSFINLNNKFNSLKGFDSPDGVQLIISDNNNDDLGFGENDLPDSDVEFTPFPSQTEPTVTPQPSNTPSDSSSAPTPTMSQTNTQAPTPTAPPTPRIDENGVENFTSTIIYDDRAMELYYYRKEKLQYYIDLLNKLQNKLSDCQIFSLIAPTSVEFYSPEKYHSLSQSQKDAIYYIYSHLNVNVKTVDAYSEISKHTDEYLYFRTDHHWTARGAYYAYTAFAKTAGLEAVSLDKFEKGRIDGFLGSFYKSTQSLKLEKNPDYVELFMPFTNHTGEIYKTVEMVNPYSIKAVRTKISSSNKYLAFIGGDSPITIFKTDVKNNKKILITKESFGNAFIPFLLPHYEEIYVIDPRQIQFDLCKFIKDKGIQDVLVIDYTIAAGNSKYLSKINDMIID